MIIILSQKIDTDSTYADVVFSSYHYPSRYRNQIHEGDTFIYYQGNRYSKEQRYYFGVGIVGKISMLDEENYRAELLNSHKFKVKVPIYLPEGGYIEQLGYSTVRKSVNPPWQSSVRPLSQQAYDFVIEKSGIDVNILNGVSLEEKKESLKKSIRYFFLEKKDTSIIDICKLSEEIAEYLGYKE